jgi:GTP-binding protein
MIIDKMNNRKGDYVSCIDQKEGKQKLMFQVPTRGLIGLRSQLMNETKGTAVL